MRISDWSSDVCSSDLRVHIAVRNNAPKQCATVGRHEAAHFRIVAEQVPDWEQAACCEKEALAVRILSELVALGRPAVTEGFGIDGLPHALLKVAGGDRLMVKIGRAHAELQSLMRISSAVVCLQKKNTHKHNI